MPHVTFVHGIANKPPAQDLLRIWRGALADAAEPLPLGDLGVTSSLVYWADLLHEKPEEDLAVHEAALENTAEAIDGSADVRAPQPRTAAEAAFLERLRATLTTRSDADLESAAPPAPAALSQGALERVPLPWALKKHFLNAYLRDVHHYLFDVVYGPPGRPPVPIQRTIRERFVEALGARAVTRPHVVVSHSMGTVIAYDCLKRVADCAPVDGLITLGSPLGLDEIQDELQPGWSRADGYPERVEAGWANLFDRLDPVCGFDPALANDYRKHDAVAVEDLPVENDGLWRHSATKYLRQASLGRTLRRLLQVRGGSP
jgi:hypothetical protein